MSGQSTVIFDSLCSGPRSRTCFRQKETITDACVIYFSFKLWGFITKMHTIKPYRFVMYGKWTNFAVS